MKHIFLTESIQETPILTTGDYGAVFAKMFLTLTFLVILLILSYWLIRRIIQQRLQKGVGIQAIQILEKRMISPKTTLYLIEVENNTRVLIAESQLEIKKIETIPSQTEIKI